jgi:hypothetical protein
MKKIFLLIAISCTNFAIAQLPETRIYTLDITKERKNIVFANPQIISFNKGYNNQPFFTSDGEAILFASNKGEGNTDIYKYNIKKKKTIRITKTPEAEYSPRLTPQEDRISCVRVEMDTVTQLLYNYDLKGKNGFALLPDEKRIGYYTWLNSVDVFAFTVPEPFALGRYNTYNLTKEIFVNNPGRTIINFRNKIFYVDKSDTNDYKIRVIAKENMRKVKNKKLIENPVIVETLAGQEDFTIMNDGTFLIGKDGKLYAYNLRKAKGQKSADWVQIADLNLLGIAQFYRLTLNADNTQMAIVTYDGLKP